MSESPQQDDGGCGVEEGFGGGDRLFEVAHEARVSAEAGEEPLRLPQSVVNLKADLANCFVYARDCDPGGLGDMLLT